MRSNLCRDRTDPTTLVRRKELAALELWRFRAVLAGHVRVLRLPRSALAYAARGGEAATDLAPDDTVCTVVYRRSHRVWHAPFDDPEGFAIERMATGRSFSEVCEAFGENVSVSDIAAKLGAWIDRGWLERLEEGSVNAT